MTLSLRNQTKRVSRKQYNTVLLCLIALSVVSAYLGLDLAADSVRASQEMISPLSDAKVIEVEQIKEVPVNVEVLNTNILDLVDYIWLKESTRGKNTNPNALHNLCKAQGKSNPYGYGGMQLKICFENDTMAKARVTLWLAEHLKTYNGNTNMALCMYRYGQLLQTCDYAEGYDK